VVSLHVGQSATISSENFTITFVSVTGDSRCPTGVQCITAGQVTCSLDVTLGEGANAETSQIIITQLGGGGDSQEDFKNYHFQFNVTPYPVAGKTIKLTDYVLHLSILKSRD
jgi:hypothetical protein